MRLRINKSWALVCAVAVGFAWAGVPVAQAQPRPDVEQKKLPTVVEPVREQLFGCQWEYDVGAALEWCDLALEVLGDPRKEDAEIADAAMPYVVDIFVARGIALNRKGDHAAAVTAFDQAIALDPEAFDVYIRRAEAYEAQGNVAQAAADIDKAAELRPGDPDAAIAAARLFLAAGDTNRARAALGVARARAPDHWAIRALEIEHGLDS